MTESALAALDTDDLRALVRNLIPWLDAPTRARLKNALVDRAARSGSGWAPEAPRDERTAEIVAFAEAARRVGYADPDTVDDFLRQASHAFLGKRYSSASRIFRALLVPIASADIDLGQHETVDEVLGVDIATCAAQYAVATYVTAAPSARAEAVLSAIQEIHDVAYLSEPLSEMERVAVEPLPDFDAFCVQWQALLRGRVGADRSRNPSFESDEERWLHEVVGRTEGIEGLARIARSSRYGRDLDAWCDAAARANDWQAAFGAFEEAAEIVRDREQWTGVFRDGAALAAHELGRKDISSWLERAWREAPSMARLLRWLGAAGTAAGVRRRASAALRACPKRAARQRASLHFVLGEIEAAAKLLQEAPGLGWSRAEHPGDLTFALLRFALGVELPADVDAFGHEESEWIVEPDAPRLATPTVAEVLSLAEVASTSSGSERAAAISALRRAAEKRLAGIVEKQRRGYYAHAASLARACVEADGSAETRAWFGGIREKYRRYPAMQRELRG